MTTTGLKTVSSQSTVTAADAAAGIRAMRKGDIDAAETLFSAAFRKKTPPAGSELRAYIASLFFDSPPYTTDNGSIVHDDGNGNIDSAIFALPMTFHTVDRTTVARLLCAFVSSGAKGALGAARLARNVRATQQDMCFSDTSSATSADHCIAAGGIILPIQSLDWHRVFQPVAALALRLQKRINLPGIDLMLPLCRMFDTALAKWKPGFRPVGEFGFQCKLEEPSAFFEHIAPMTRRFAIRPEWTKTEFDWLIEKAKLNRKLGKLQCGIVEDRQGTVIGAFLFFGNKKRVATVLNILCQPGKELDVTREMFAFLNIAGYATSQGMAQPFLMNALGRQRLMSFRHRGYFCISTRHDDLKQAALLGDIYIGGLASEQWSRMLTDF